MMRHLASLFALGGLLYLARPLWAKEQRTPLVVTVPQSASQQETDQRTRETILASEALARGAAEIDPIVRDELLRQSRLLYPGDEPDEARIKAAIALGLPLSDPLLRKRLASHFDPLLSLGRDAQEIDDAELLRYLRDHRERYKKPETVSFLQVFRKAPRDAADGEWAVVRERLAQEPASASLARSLSDPTLVPLSFRSASISQVERRLGRKFAQQLRKQPVGSWSGPIDSPYGEHLVWISARKPAHPAELQEVRKRLEADYRHDRRAHQAEARVAELASRYEVKIKRARP